MARATKTKINESLHDFLFAQIESDESYKRWAINYRLPEYITDNLAVNKPLRDYQIEAIKHFIYLFEVGDRSLAKQLLFNMATGTGKTLVMAACVLYLYEHGYRKFIFLVHQIQILEQARKNFTQYSFDKYLFNKNGVKFNGRRIQVREVERLQDATSNDINFMFFSTSLLYNRLKVDVENGLTREDFQEQNLVIIADEAHRLNVETRSNRTAVENTELLNWETAVMGAVNARPGNLLLEFTATVDLANAKIHTKYKDKIIFKYDFLAFNKDGYSKDVKFLYNYETEIEDQRKFLIVNAVALSQYRKILFRQFVKEEINPIVLIKSKKIADSNNDREYFNQVVESLRPSDLEKLKSTQQDELGLIGNMFAWLSNNRITLDEFIADIKQDFSPNNTLIYNSQKKERADLLAELDSPRNTVRAIFSVNALNEGWDVLGLFDIIHFDISETKSVSLQDIQLIGRGARYRPFDLPKNFEDNMFGSYETDPFKRKFDNAPLEVGRILETFFYHFVKTGTFLEKLQEELMGEGIMNEGVERKVIRMKPGFTESDTYKNGFVLVNRTEKRLRTTDEDIDKTFKRAIHASSYQLRARALTDLEQNTQQSSQATAKINIVIDFEDPVILKALMRAENGFFRFANLKEHVIGLETIDDFISKYLSLYDITYSYEPGKEIHKLNPNEKLQLLVGVILPGVRQAIDINMPRVVGSKTFRPVSIEWVFEKEKAIYFTSFPVIDEVTGEKKYISTDERFKAQSDHDNPDLRLDISRQDWYAYDENYGTSEEKKFVLFMSRNINRLRQEYPGTEIYVVRNELDYWLFNPADARRFSPDYLVFINDAKNKRLYYQCIIEVKGGHLLQQDEWKEEALESLSDGAEVSFEQNDENIDKVSGGKAAYQRYLDKVRKSNYKQIKNLGFKFYNTDPRDESEFALDFEARLFNERQR